MEVFIFCGLLYISIFGMVALIASDVGKRKSNLKYQGPPIKINVKVNDQLEEAVLLPPRF